MAANAEYSSQILAGAALSFLSNFDVHGTQVAGPDSTFLGHLTPPDSDQEALQDTTRLTVPSIKVTTPAYAQGEALMGHDATVATINNPHAGIATHALPSLLRYVDNDLMQNAALHNLPPHPIPACCICFAPWNTPVIPTQSGHAASTSTFLPLSPCGHWVHYRCFIWLATMNDGRRNKCCTCNMRLFEWDGINALTLATRTKLELDDNTRPSFFREKFGAFKPTDRLAYESECAVIDSVIHSWFFVHLAKPSEHTDGSPDLVQCFYDVLEVLLGMGMPKSRWLQYSTQTGYLLWCMLVMLKMRRYLAEGHERIQTTEGWREFEEGGKALQGRILGEVHRP